MDGVELVNVSQMRNASALHFTVTNADGQEVWSDAVTNVPKTIYASSQGGPIPATMYQDMAPDAWYGTDSNGNAPCLTASTTTPSPPIPSPITRAAMSGIP